VKTFLIIVPAFLTININVNANDYENEALALLHLAAAKQRMLKARDFPTYAQQGCHTKGTLITFVGVTPRTINNQQTCYASDLDEITRDPGVVVSRDGIWLTTLSANATDADIINATKLSSPIVTIERQVSREATPFSSSSNSNNLEVGGQVPVVVDDRSSTTVGLRYNPTHRCPTCGATVTAISGRGPTRGTHIHICPRDGPTWYH